MGTEFKGGMSMSPSALSPEPYNGRDGMGQGGYGGFGGGGGGGGGGNGFSNVNVKTPQQKKKQDVRREHFHNQPTPTTAKGAYNFESLSLE